MAVLEAITEVRAREIAGGFTGYMREYWRGVQFDERWLYIGKTAELVCRLRPESVLEIGAGGIPVVPGGETMDVNECYKPTYRYDARNVPWPLSGTGPRVYDLVIANQVFEHLGDVQRAVFDEIRMISRHAVITLPYEWTSVPKDDEHYGIDMSVIGWWTRFAEPVESEVLEAPSGVKRIWLHYAF